jgi:hypothetical protein
VCGFLRKRSARLFGGDFGIRRSGDHRFGFGRYFRCGLYGFDHRFIHDLFGFDRSRLFSHRRLFRRWNGGVRYAFRRNRIGGGSHGIDRIYVPFDFNRGRFDGINRRFSSRRYLKRWNFFSSRASRIRFRCGIRLRGWLCRRSIYDLSGRLGRHIERKLAGGGLFHTEFSRLSWYGLGRRLRYGVGGRFNHDRFGFGRLFRSCLRGIQYRCRGRRFFDDRCDLNMRNLHGLRC